MKRTDYCGTLGEKDVGRTVTVCGWVLSKRDMGGVIFIDLRDREGTLQVVFDSGIVSGDDFNMAEGLRNQSVLSVTGMIRIRGEETYNPKIATGTIELAAEHAELLSAADPLPFIPDDNIQIREELRLRYRYLDLRRPRMIENLRLRQRVVRAAQAFLDGHGFIEVETPILTKSTPEGARDYLVPSRVHPGTFYALPQSPQIFKQLLMVGGIDRYYQVARCFRDEDLRADRQPEFTQVDMEMSFVGQDDVLDLLEDLFRHIFESVMGICITEPFPRLTWTEAMDRYGSDKPDLRFGLPIVDLTEKVRGSGFGVFRKAVECGGVVRAINVKGGASLTRSEIDELTEKALDLGAKGMAWIAVRESGELYSILTKFMTQEELEGILDAADAGPGDFILFCADKLPVVRKTLGGLRLYIADMLNLRRKDDYKFLFVTDFPQFEYSEEENRYVATHHPFTMPYPEDLQYLFTDPSRVRAQAYDVVLNGIELGSGSIRIHRSDVQQMMFKALGFTPDEIKERFGFMIDAFRYGTPPHGGFAFGLDRLVMLMAGADSIREVIAFPKAKDASCPLTSAPGVVDQKQLEVLHLQHRGSAKQIRSNVDLMTVGDTDTIDFNQPGFLKPVMQKSPFEPVGQLVEGKSKRQNRVPSVDVDKVAKLACLRIRDEEREAITREMLAIISFADKLKDIDTEGVPVTSHVVPIANVFRNDIPQKPLERGLVLFNAPSGNEHYVVVPRTVE